MLQHLRKVLLQGHSVLSERPESQSLSRRRSGNGGPPVNDNIPDWRITVKNELAPISYNLWVLSDLFDEIPEITDKWTAKRSFLDGIANYCRIMGCKQATPDAPMPQPAPMTFTDTTAYGGEGRQPFRGYISDRNYKLIKVILRKGSFLDNIQLQFFDGVNNVYTNKYGGTGGDEVLWFLPSGDEIKKIEIRSGQFVDAVRFYTRAGVISPLFGGNGGQVHFIDVPDNMRVVGIYGRNGFYLDKLGFVLGTK